MNHKDLHTLLKDFGYAHAQHEHYLELYEQSVDAGEDDMANAYGADVTHGSYEAGSLGDQIRLHPAMKFKR